MSRPRVTVMRSAHHVDCPACGVEINIDDYDAGAYDGAEYPVDCDVCGAVVQTVGVVLVVASLDLSAAYERAARIRGKATTSGTVRDLIARARQ